MPFASEFSDLFEYGIQRPVRDLGFLCERVDQDVFTGDILERIKSQIEASAAIIAVLTGANPNVYLEVGYAWGKGRPTILITDDAEEPEDSTSEGSAVSDIGESKTSRKHSCGNSEA